MGEAFIKRGTGGVDIDELGSEAAGVNDVMKGKKFYGAGSDEPQIGGIINQGAINHTLSEGGTYNIPEGYHNGQGKITVNSVPTMAGQTITPSSSAQTVQCSGKKMTGNIAVKAIPSKYVDLSAGQVVFNDGTVSEILGGIVPKYVIRGTTLFEKSSADIEYDGKLPIILFSTGYEPIDGTTTYLVFSKTINFDKVKKIELELEIDGSSSRESSITVLLLGSSKSRSSSNYDTSFVSFPLSSKNPVVEITPSAFSDATAMSGQKFLGFRCKDCSVSAISSICLKKLTLYSA